MANIKNNIFGSKRNRLHKKEPKKPINQFAIQLPKLIKKASQKSMK